MSYTSLSDLERALYQAHNIVSGVSPSQFNEGTPCAKWNVKDLLNHMVGGQTTSEFPEFTTVKDLLTPTSGVPFVSGAKWRDISTSWIDEFFKLPVESKPESKSVYSSATSFMASSGVGRNAR